MTKGRSIRMFLVDGSPSGIITAEIMNWTGHVMAGPRSRLADLVKRPEASRTGVYFLTGLDPATGMKVQVYVGESDNVGKRLAQHNRSEDNGGKDFWDRACVITSKDQNLTKAHVRFIESSLISIAKATGRAAVSHGTAPEYGYLPEADTADMEFFIEQIRIILPVLGLDFLRDKPKFTKDAALVTASVQPDTALEPQAAESTSLVEYEITSKKYGLHASAREVDGDFVVLAGSTAQPTWIGDQKHNTHYWRLHEQLREDGILVPTNGLSSFKEDYPFTSPSAAAAIVFGRSSNGRTSWKVKGTGKTYADFQEAQVSAATEANADIDDPPVAHPHSAPLMCAASDD